MAIKKTNACCDDKLNLPEELEEGLCNVGGLTGLAEKVPGRAELSSQAEKFHALSDTIRLQIMHALKQCDLCPCILKRVTGLSDSKLSYPLNILEKADLIESHQVKNWRVYALTQEARRYL